MTGGAITSESRVCRSFFARQVYEPCANARLLLGSRSSFDNNPGRQSSARSQSHMQAIKPPKHTQDATAYSLEVYSHVAEKAGHKIGKKLWCLGALIARK